MISLAQLRVALPPPLRVQLEEVALLVLARLLGGSGLVTLISYCIRDHVQSMCIHIHVHVRADNTTMLSSRVERENDQRE